MSGILVNGVQYGRCTRCGEWEQTARMGTRPVSVDKRYGEDLCVPCDTGRKRADVAAQQMKDRTRRMAEAMRQKNGKFPFWWDQDKQDIYPNYEEMV